MLRLLRRRGGSEDGSEALLELFVRVPGVVLQLLEALAELRSLRLGTGHRCEVGAGVGIGVAAISNFEA